MSARNLLFIFTDEQRYDTLTAYGNHAIDTPNLDRLAERSVVFERAYCTQPVCTPSRASIMTGLYPHSCRVPYNNFPLRPEYPTLVELADFSDYDCAYHGKWHLGDEVFPQHGFSEWISIEDAMYREYFSEERPRDARSSYFAWLRSHGLEPFDALEDGYTYFSRSAAARLPEELSKPAFLAETASAFLESHRDVPFVLYVNFLEPHMPFTGPRDDMYDPATVSLPPAFGLEETERPVPYAQDRIDGSVFKRSHLGTDDPTEGDYRKLIARYWGLVSQVDAAVGRILDTLAACGLTDDTVVVFTSDHGDMMGEHALLTKGVQYEGAVRVPLLVSAPTIPMPHSVSEPVSQVDLVPTILELLGKGGERRVDGSYLVPVLDSRAVPGRDVFVEWNETGDLGQSAARGDIRTIVTPDGWKLNYSALGHHELYNLTDDPNERRNVFAAEHAVARELAARVRHWQDATADTVDLPPL